MTANKTRPVRYVLFVPGKGLIHASDGQVLPDKGTTTNGLAAANVINESLQERTDSYGLVPFDVIFFAGSSPEDFPECNTSEADQMYSIYRKRISELRLDDDFRKPEVRLDEKSKTTFENVRGLINLNKQYPFEYVSILASQEHGRRVQQIAQNAFQGTVFFDCLDSREYIDPNTFDHSQAYQENWTEIIKESLIRRIATASFVGLDISDPEQRLSVAEERYKRITERPKELLAKNRFVNLSGYGRS